VCRTRWKEEVRKGGMRLGWLLVDGLVGESDAHGEDDADHDQDQEAPDREIRTVCFDEYCDGDEYQRGQDEHLHVSREVPGVGHALQNKRLSRKY
jgi:hypothetical protein